MPGRHNDESARLSAGMRVRVRRSPRAPYGGRCGNIVCIDQSDSKGAYLVRFEDGTEFRYTAGEIESAKVSQVRIPTQYLGKIMKVKSQIFLAIVVVSGALVSSCGPAPNPKL